MVTRERTTWQAADFRFTSPVLQTGGSHAGRTLAMKPLTEVTVGGGLLTNTFG